MTARPNHIARCARLLTAGATLLLFQIAAAALDPAQVEGPEACGECHANEVEAWKRTHHAATYHEMHRKEKAQEIAEKLGIRRIKSESVCIDCHYTPQDDDVIAGTSCESCHGAAAPWMEIHNDFGEYEDAENEPPEHREQRLAAAAEHGMIRPGDLYSVAQNCFQCHVVPKEELVNVGGHPAGSKDFELVAWSQGEIRHNFQRGATDVNESNPPEHLRMMFVLGMILDLEASLRGTALATQRADYGTTMARRADYAKRKLAQVNGLIAAPQLGEIVATVDGVELKLNNGDELNGAADRVAELGRQFAAAAAELDLSALDQYLPGPDKLKGDVYQP